MAYTTSSWSLGYPCMVVAPSLVPTKPGGHIKTDRRDAKMLAALFRAGELQSVWVPDAEHEAMRELVRARQTAMQEVRRSRQLLLFFSTASRPRHTDASSFDQSAPELACPAEFRPPSRAGRV